MPSLSSAFASFTIVAFVCCSVGEAKPLSDDERTVFYVFGSEAIYVIDPENKTVLSKIGPDGVCTKSNNRYSRKNCSFGYGILARDDLLFFSDSPGKRVHVIDVRKREVVETIATEAYPFDLYYLSWLEEVWVHSWGLSTFDVINVAGKLEKTHKAIKAHVNPGWTHGYMYADQQFHDGIVGYVTHMDNPGLHRLDLNTKSYIGFVNVSSQGCSGTFNFAYSSVNKHAFVECFASRRAVALLEMDLTKNVVVHKWNFTGKPYASPDGRFIVTIYKSVNETTNLLRDGKVYVLLIHDKYSAPILKSTLDIPFGVSQLVFVKKVGQEDGYVAYITLVYSDKIAVLDLDQLESGSPVSYIEGAGNVFSRPGMHSVSRTLAASGRWLVSPASANNSVAIIDTSTRKLHGMVMNVVGGKRLVAVPPRRTTPPTTNAAEGVVWRLQETWLFMSLSCIYILIL